MIKTKKIEVEIIDVSSLTREEAQVKAMLLATKILVMQNEHPADLFKIAKLFLEMDEIIKIHGDQEK
ncbi:MAG: hypothetical protein ACRCYA_13320 [Cetobacterium sp.]|uniref:hypothetical protein n=1 Tax=Cetobacterium sp. TaxID=2071632 RepID=UPI003F2FAAB1